MRLDDNRETAIEVKGFDNTIRDNLIVGTGGTTAFGANAVVYAIRLFGSNFVVDENDVIDNKQVGSGNTYGILFDGADNGVATSNRLTTATIGIAYGGVATGVIRDNVTTDVTTPYSLGAGGMNAGNND
jgi:hypothetical protein